MCVFVLSFRRLAGEDDVGLSKKTSQNQSLKLFAMHKKCGFKAFLKLLGLFKHHTNILVGTNVLDCACAKS